MWYHLINIRRSKIHEDPSTGVKIPAFRISNLKWDLCQISNLKWHLYQLILELFISQPSLSWFYSQRWGTGSLEPQFSWFFRFPLQDEFNTIQNPHISLLLPSKYCAVALADGNVSQQDWILPQQSTNSINNWCHSLMQKQQLWFSLSQTLCTTSNKQWWS